MLTRYAFLVLFVSTYALAISQGTEGGYPNVVQARFRNATSGAYSYATGAVIDYQNCIITDGKALSASSAVDFWKPSGATVTPAPAPGQAVYTGQKWIFNADLGVAVVRVNQNTGGFLRRATKPPPGTSSTTFVGYGKKDSTFYVPSQVGMVILPEYYENGFIVATPNNSVSFLQPGDQGGPLLDSVGNVFGILNPNDSNYYYGYVVYPFADIATPSNYFSQATYTLCSLKSTQTLTVHSVGPGTVQSSPSTSIIQCGPNNQNPGYCVNEVVTGGMVTLQAIPGNDSVFVGWSESCSGTSSTCNVTLSQAKSVTANFKSSNNVTLKVSVSGYGKVDGTNYGINCPSGSCVNESITVGTKVTLSAIPDPGKSFYNWSGDVSEAQRYSPTITLTMDGNRSVTASFTAPRSVNLSIYTNAKGKVTDLDGYSCSTNCVKTYPQGSTVTLSAVPNSGYYFVGWTGDCSGLGTCSLKMDGNRTVTAIFDPLVTTPNCNSDFPHTMTASTMTFTDILPRCVARSIVFTAYSACGPMPNGIPTTNPTSLVLAGGFSEANSKKTYVYLVNDGGGATITQVTVPVKFTAFSDGGCTNKSVVISIR